MNISPKAKAGSKIASATPVVDATPAGLSIIRKISPIIKKIPPIINKI